MFVPCTCTVSLVWLVQCPYSLSALLELKAGGRKTFFLKTVNLTSGLIKIKSFLVWQFRVTSKKMEGIEKNGTDTYLFCYYIDVRSDIM